MRAAARGAAATHLRPAPGPGTPELGEGGNADGGTPPEVGAADDDHKLASASQQQQQQQQQPGVSQAGSQQPHKQPAIAPNPAPGVAAVAFKKAAAAAAAASAAARAPIAVSAGGLDVLDVGPGLDPDQDPPQQRGSARPPGDATTPLPASVRLAEDADTPLPGGRGGGGAVGSGGGAGGAGGGPLGQGRGMPEKSPPLDDLTRIKYQLFTAAGEPLPPSRRAHLQAASELLEGAAEEAATQLMSMSQQQQQQLGMLQPAPPQVLPFLGMSQGSQQQLSQPGPAQGPAQGLGRLGSQGLPPVCVGSAPHDPMEMSQQQPQQQYLSMSFSQSQPQSQEAMDMSQRPQTLQQSPELNKSLTATHSGAAGPGGAAGGSASSLSLVPPPSLMSQPFSSPRSGQAPNAAGSGAASPSAAAASLLPEYASWPVLRLQTADGPKTTFVAPSMVSKVVREHGLATAAPKRAAEGAAERDAEEA